MRKKLADAVRKTFKDVLVSVVPDFQAIEVEGLPKGCRVFERKLENGSSGFILLIVSPKYDEFTLELAWSQKGIFPVNWGGITLPDDPPINGDHRFRMQRIWGENIGEDKWWNIGSKLDDNDWLDLNAILEMDLLEDEALAKVGPQVMDAVKKIERYAIPYLDTMPPKND